MKVLVNQCNTAKEYVQSSVASAVQDYICKQPGCKFFEAARIFDPRTICGNVTAVLHVTLLHTR